MTGERSSSSKESRRQRTQSDVFDKGSEDEEDARSAGEGNGKLPDDFDQLPIELVSLSDRSVFQSL